MELLDLTDSCSSRNDFFRLEKDEGASYSSKASLSKSKFHMNELDFPRPECIIDSSEMLTQLSRALEILKLKGSSSSLTVAKCFLERLHESGLVWTIDIAKDSQNSWGRLLALYFSIPDRIAPLFELDSESALLHGNFFKIISKLMPTNCDERVVDIFYKCLSHGASDYLVHSMVRQGMNDIITICIVKLSGSRFDAFIQSFLRGLSVYALDSIDLFGKCKFYDWDLITRKVTLTTLVDCSCDVLSCVLMAMATLTVPIIHAARVLFEVWAVKTDLNRTPLHQQRHLSKQLLVFLSFFSYATIKTNKLEFAILNGVQKRLNSSDSDIALLGKVVGECYALLVDTETRLIFQVEGDVAEDLRRGYSFSRVLQETICLQEGWPIVCGERLWSPERLADSSIDDHVVGEPIIKGKSPEGLSAVMKPIMTMTSADEVPRNAKIKSPRFLRDCLAYLKTPDDPEKIELGLNYLAPLMDSASQILKEEIGAELYKSVLFMGEGFKIKDFDTIRRRVMVKLTRENVSIMAPIALEEIMGRRTSIRQKLEILCSTMCALRSAPQRSTPISLDPAAIKLRLLDSQIGFAPLAAASMPLALKNRRIIRHLVIPLLTLVTDADHRLFKGNANAMLLEKMIYLFAITVDAAAPLPEFRDIAQGSLAFLRPIIKSAEGILRPTLKATLVAAHSLLSSWPETLPMVEYVEDIEAISHFLQVNSSVIVDLEKEYLSLVAASMVIIEQRSDPLRLIQEASSFATADSFMTPIV